MLSSPSLKTRAGFGASEAARDKKCKKRAAERSACFDTLAEDHRSGRGDLLCAFAEEVRKRRGFDRVGGGKGSASAASRRRGNAGEFHSGFSTRKLDRHQVAGQSITGLVLLLAPT